MSNEIEKVVIIGSGCAASQQPVHRPCPTQTRGAHRRHARRITDHHQHCENFPGWPEGIDGTDLMIKLQQQAERFGAEVRFGSTVESVNLSERPFRLTVDGEPMLAQTLIVASGAAIVILV